MGNTHLPEEAGLPFRNTSKILASFSPQVYTVIAGPMVSFTVAKFTFVSLSPLRSTWMFLLGWEIKSYLPDYPQHLVC